MSTDRPDDLDDLPPRRPDRAPRDDYGEVVPPPRPLKKRGFGFWMAVVWSLLYFAVTQIIAGIGFGVLIIGIALIPEIRKHGMDALQPDKLNAWMQGPAGTTATLLVVAGTQVAGLALSWLLFRLIVGRSWKRKIALTRGPTATHFALVVIGLPAMLALAATVDTFITRYIPSLQQILDALGVPLPGMEGTDEMLGKLIGQSPWALALFVVGVTPAVCEEVFCRGFLGWGLSYRYKSWAVVLIVSFLFGCLHGDPRQGVGAMCLGAAIHGSYLATRSLWVPMFVHWANNSVGVIHMHPKLYPILDPYEHLLTGPVSSALLFVLSASLMFGAVAHALYQTRCKLVAVDPASTWRPDNPRGMEVPPPDSGVVVAHDPLSATSVTLILIGAVAFGLVMALA